VDEPVTSEGAPGEGGTAAEEAARLFEAVQDWARRSAQASAHVATGSPECQLCPVCQVISLLRDVRPEVATHLTDAVTSLAAALRAAIVAHEHEWSARRGGGVERIDIG
jgi:hypothetical protein